MHQSVILLSLAAAVLADKDFSEKYTFTKVMASCLGEDAYYDYLAQVGTAQRECQQLPVSSLQTVGYPYYHQPGYLNSPAGYSPHIQHPLQHQQHSGPIFGVPQGYPQYHLLQKRESDGNVSTGAAPKKPFFDQYYLLDSINTITASLSNYTCVLHKLGLIDEYLNLRVDNYIQQINQKPISQELKKDLADGATYCRDLTYCLPVERLKSPLPLNLQRLLLAMKCEKEARIDACFKEDIRRNIHEFDLSLFPKDDTQESKLNKLSAIVMEADSVDELQVL
ncbi:uncharacterized protein [Palaemon carinicauda]|uniref:uncharacterized protein n=1 Tax=Palaemon carinicauda TaxID=392227 RepID=UPI0035B67EFF